jgi:hypothetical protein
VKGLILNSSPIPKKKKNHVNKIKDGNPSNKSTRQKETPRDTTQRKIKADNQQNLSKDPMQRELMSTK